jgi:DNA-binding winged helix-turn-helix (wHTH) protein
MRSFQTWHPGSPRDQPFQILTALLEHPGEVVTREQLCASLWPRGPTSISTKPQHGRQKTPSRSGDSAENFVFIETVPRRGYRFVAPVHADPLPLSEPPPDRAEEPAVLVEDPRPTILASSAPTPKKAAAWLIALGLVVAGTCWEGYRLAFPPMLRVTQITRLTNSGHVEPWGGIASDGSRLFFLEREGDHWNNRQISAAGGESAPFDSPFKNTKTFAVSPDQSEILLVPFTSRDSNRPLWSMPLVGGAPRPVGDIVVDGVAYSPDGTKIAFTNPSGVYIANRDGSEVRQLASLPAWAIDWSPNGQTLRFAANAPTQVHISGKSVPPAVIFIPSFPVGTHLTGIGLLMAPITSSVLSKTTGKLCGPFANLRRHGGRRCPYNSLSLQLPTLRPCPSRADAGSTLTARSLAASTWSLRSPHPPIQACVGRLSSRGGRLFLRIGCGCSTAQNPTMAQSSRRRRAAEAGGRLLHSQHPRCSLECRLEACCVRKQ